MINILAIATQAADEACDDDAGDFNAEIITVFEEKFIIDKTVSLLMHDPILTMAMTQKSGVAAIQVVCAWYWQMGRLYGQQEIIDQYLEGKVK